MYATASSPQYAFGPGLAPVPMPVYKKGGEVEERRTYGLENAAEMLRQRGRGDDTILAHINPQEAGILKLLGGSGTTNPYTGLPEFKFLPGIKSIPIVGKPIYKLGSAIGKGIESGVESIAKALGPVGSIAAAYFGGPIGAALYQGLAAPGSSFDTKNAIKAAALTYAGNAISGASNPMAPRFDYSNAFGSGMEYVPMSDVSSVASSAPSVGEAVAMSGPGSFDAGVGLDSMSGGPGYSYTDTLANVQPITAPPSGIGEPFSQSASAASTATDAIPSAPSAPAASAPYSADVGEVPGVTSTSGATPVDTRSAFSQGIDTVRQGYNTAVEGVKSLVPEPIRDAYSYAKELIPENYREILSTAKDVALVGSGAATAYGMYQTKKELEAAKAEADRILADQANRKKEEVEWAQGVMRDYPYNYKRLTEEEVRSERGMAMGGRINSYDDEPGGDDGMMQGGIAALAKGGLPPRYLRGGGDGMSDSIKASIEGKQEARLADGEFVVPADVVSHLGNGSSNAGAKKLYSMMDRVRRSRTGKTRQAPEINTRSMMPA
jgi:hypothetical protein